MNLPEARARAAAHIREGARRLEGYTPVIVDGATRALPWGWVFFYNSEDYVRTGDVIYALAGNSPIVVTRDGEIYETGTARQLSEYLEQIHQHWSKSR